MKDQSLAYFSIFQIKPILPPQRQVLLLELRPFSYVQFKDFHQTVACEHRYVRVFLVTQFYQDVKVHQQLFLGY